MRGPGRVWRWPEQIPTFRLAGRHSHKKIGRRHMWKLLRGLFNVESGTYFFFLVVRKFCTTQCRASSSAISTPFIVLPRWRRLQLLQVVYILQEAMRVGTLPHMCDSRIYDACRWRCCLRCPSLPPVVDRIAFPQGRARPAPTRTRSNN